MSAKILCACANGSGTSLMMQLTVERVAKKLGMDVSEVHHCALAEGTSTATNFGSFTWRTRRLFPAPGV